VLPERNVATPESVIGFPRMADEEIPADVDLT
jgi:hypothetical protein